MAWISGSMPLFLRGEYLAGASGGLSLFAHGVPSGASGWFAGLDLYLNAVSGNQPQASVTLFAQGPPAVPTGQSIPLYLLGANPSAQGSLELYLHGPSGSSLSLPLYTKGAGLFPGSKPASGQITLYLARNPANTLELFLQGPGVTTGSGLLLYTAGHLSASSGLPLFASGVWASSSSLRLYSHGG